MGSCFVIFVTCFKFLCVFAKTHMFAKFLSILWWEDFRQFSRQARNFTHFVTVFRQSAPRFAIVRFRFQSLVCSWFAHSLASITYCCHSVAKRMFRIYVYIVRVSSVPDSQTACAESSVQVQRLCAGLAGTPLLRCAATDALARLLYERIDGNATEAKKRYFKLFVSRQQ